MFGDMGNRFQVKIRGDSGCRTGFGRPRRHRPPLTTVNLVNFGPTEIHAKQAVLVQGPQAHATTAKSLAHLMLAAVETDTALGAHFAEEKIKGILETRSW